MMRCSDCLQDFAPNDVRFVVLDPPTREEFKREMGAYREDLHPAEVSMVYAMMTRVKHVCAECVRWYDEYAEVPA